MHSREGRRGGAGGREEDEVREEKREEDSDGGEGPSVEEGSSVEEGPSVEEGATSGQWRVHADEHGLTDNEDVAITHPKRRECSPRLCVRSTAGAVQARPCKRARRTESKEPPTSRHGCTRQCSAGALAGEYALAPQHHTTLSQGTTEPLYAKPTTPPACAPAQAT